MLSSGLFWSVCLMCACVHLHAYVCVCVCVCVCCVYMCVYQLVLQLRSVGGLFHLQRHKEAEEIVTLQPHRSLSTTPQKVSCPP